MSFGITPLDFGINAHTLIHNAEFAAQASPTIFDIDPDAGSEGKITTVTWNGTSYIPKFADGSQGNAGTYNAQETANWLRTVLGKTKGHGVKFASLSPDDEALNEIEEEDDSNGGTDCPQDSCPEGTLAVSSTDADGVVTCRCVETGDIGEGLGKIGMGLGALALVPVAIAGIVVFGLVKIIKD